MDLNDLILRQPPVVSRSNEDCPSRAQFVVQNPQRPQFTSCRVDAEQRVIITADTRHEGERRRTVGIDIHCRHGTDKSIRRSVLKDAELLRNDRNRSFVDVLNVDRQHLLEGSRTARRFDSDDVARKRFKIDRAVRFQQSVFDHEATVVAVAGPCHQLEREARFAARIVRNQTPDRSNDRTACNTFGNAIGRQPNVRDEHVELR